jgi:hypothetical protein
VAPSLRDGKEKGPRGKETEHPLVSADWARSLINEQARAVRLELNPSRLVQVAFELWCGNRSLAFSHDPPSDIGDAFDLARHRLAAHARQEFERGYRKAVTVAGTIEWWALEALANQHFSVRLWAENLAMAAYAERDGEVPKGAGPDGRRS